MPLGGRRQRVLLALLLLEAGREVAADHLAEELWQGRPPAGCEATLRAYVSKLRTALGGDIPLTRGGSGYLLDVPPGAIDARRFERLSREGREALARCVARRGALHVEWRCVRGGCRRGRLEPSEGLKRLEQAILRHDVPAARPVGERHNLPAPITSFVGRAAELEDAERLLAGARLVTLTGVGGAGKTRLALEVATRWARDTGDEVAFVDLSGLDDPALVARQIAYALNVSERSDLSPADQLAQRLREADLLLVLDNCEHLREATADLAQRLLQSCPRLRVLATSRELLSVAGEIDFAVPPLGIPAAEADVDELRSSEAVQLFLARAREARPRLPDEPAAIEATARICRDLDGLPLAIELAAARAKALSLDEIAAGLADRFRFLVSWRRLSAARHRTLEDAMDWSYALLAEDERALLARLSVFAGGFTNGAVAAVCLEGDEGAAAELVGRLVDASLIVAEEREGRMRYRLLETVRQYGAVQLEKLTETAAQRQRHAEFFLSLAEESWVGIRRDEQSMWVERLGRENDNLRAALAWSRDHGSPTQELRLAEALWWFWWVHGDFAEGRAWLDGALARDKGLDAGLRARALEGAAGLAWAQNDLVHARELAEMGRNLHAGLGDLRGEAGCLIVLGLAARARGEPDAAEPLFDRSRELFEALGDDIWGRQCVPEAIHNLGSVSLDQGCLPRAAQRFEKALSLWLAEPDVNRAGIAVSELYLGLVAVEGVRFDDAAESLRRALDLYAEIGFPQYTAECLEGIAAVVHARGEPNEAACLLGAASALRADAGYPPFGSQERLRERELASTRAELGEPAFAAAWTDGRALSRAEALARARAAVGG